MANDYSELYASVYKGFTIAAIITFILGITTTGKTSFGCYQVGYSVFAIAVMLILIKILNNFLGKNNGAISLGNTILTLSPFIILAFVLGFLIYFNITYQTLIIDKHVSNGYYTFSNIIIVLLLIQLFVISSVVGSDTFNEKGMSQLSSSIILLLGVITAICTNILHTILKYFSTDGFQSEILKI
jgi:hypothetical protein